MDSEIREYIIEGLINSLDLTGEEWVDVYITPLNRIDITIVSSNAEKIEENSVSGFVKDILGNIPGIVVNNYSIGFIELYTVEDAEDLGIHKVEIKRNPITWSDVININKQKSEREKREGLYKVISFYSYKGGVGRTIAMIQVAYLLAKQGRRVLLVDLDIEAPSLHRIFKKQVNDETYGIKFGLVDYLFEKTINTNEKDHKIKTTDLFCEISFDEPLSGNIYVLPSTKQLNSQYIFKLTQLQTNIIFENRYLEDLMNNLEREINIDTVLIDSRTGINQWGAFSLLGFADQIVFVTYPNEENIEGINEVIRLMKEAGLENFVVSMSKIVPTSEGQKYSNSLFEKLNIHQEIPIDIPYNSSIAMTDSFPVINVSEPYKNLSDFIIENDIIDFNISYLNKSNRLNLIKNIFHSGVADIITDSESKVLRENNYNVLIYNKFIGLEKLIKFSSKSLRRFGRSVLISDEEGRRILYRPRLFSIWYTSENSDLITCLIKNKTDNWALKWYAFILFSINQFIETEKNIENLCGIVELFGKDYEAYYQYLTKFNENEILEKIKSAIQAETKGIYFDNDEIDFGQNTTKILHQAVNIYIDVSLFLNQTSGDQFLITLINTIKLLKKSIPDLRIVAAANSETYESYEKQFTDLKGSVISLDWNENDIKRLLIVNINTSTFEDYFKELYSSKKHTVSVGENEMETENLYTDEDNELTILNLILGSRTLCGKYSESMIGWFYKKLKTLPYISSEIIINIIKSAAESELNNLILNISDRLISRESINLSIESYLNDIK